MTAIPLLQAVQGIPTPAVFAKNVGNPAALENFYHGWSFTNIGDEAIKKKYDDMYKAYYPDREAGPFMITGLPSAMAVAAALEKAGRNLTRDSFVAAMESLDFKPEIMAGPLQFGKDRRDAMRSRLRREVRRQDAEADAGRLHLERQGRAVVARFHVRSCLVGAARPTSDVSDVGHAKLARNRAGPTSRGRPSQR